MGLAFDPKSAALYGSFVQAAYSMNSKNPNSLSPPASEDFPTGYQLVAWIQMQDFILGSTDPVFYGFVAQSLIAPSQFVVALRGTANGVEVLDDLNAVFKTPFKIPNCGMVAQGFARIYDTIEVVECPHSLPTALGAAAPRSLLAAGGLSQQIAALTRRRAPAPPAVAANQPVRAFPFGGGPSVEVTGHSLGAALATMYVMENARQDAIPTPALCTFASPLVGDADFANAFNGLGLTSWRVANVQDVVTVVPPAILGFQHVDADIPVSSAGVVRPDFLCRHALATYLSLIDPQKQPDPACKPFFSLGRPLGEAPRAAAGAGAAKIFRPVAIDLYQGDNVQDTPQPLGGFARVKALGIPFLLHKVTEGVNLVDRRYSARRAAWMDGASIPVTDVDGQTLQLAPKFAAYHFLIGDDPEAEAQHFLKNAQLQPGDDAVVDWEQSRGRDEPPSADAVDRFCNVVERQLGFSIIVYSGNVAKELLKGKDPRFAKRRLWLAQYSRSFTVQESWSFPWLWQNNGDSSGPGPNTIDGIDGVCDNSTIVGPMTIKRLHDEWGGGRNAPVVGRRLGTPPVAPTKRRIARYGWKPDLPDQRDYSFAAPANLAKAMGASVDLRPQCPPVYDQGQIGSCTANAIAAALEFDMIKQNTPSFTPSRLFIYYNERNMEGTVGTDAGAFIRDGIKSVATYGDCPESEWTYDGAAAGPNGVFPPGAKAATSPSAQCYQDAVRHRAMSYMSVDQNMADMKGCLASGYPFVFGFTVYPSFESEDVARSGIVPLPGSNESTIGGHAVLAVGYDDNRSAFIVRNSWGPNWGLAGYCYMPYSYLLDNNLSDDFWTIRLIA